MAFTQAKKERRERDRNSNKCKLQDLCEEKGYTMKFLNDYQVRINGVLDIYVTTGRYHHIRKNKRGDINNLEEDVQKLL